MSHATCRLLGVVAREPAPLKTLLTDDLPPFLGLACEHADGWGIASTTPTEKIAVVKEPVRADDSSRFDHVVTKVTTDAALLHLRMATPGHTVTVHNTHPFGDGTMAFAHNGAFSPSTCLDRTLGWGLLGTAEGDTDSERYYLAVRSRIDAGMAPPEAIMDAAEDIRSRTTDCAGLNCLLLTTDALYAYASHDPAAEVLGRRGPDFFTLNYRRRPQTVVVASTGWPQTPPRWATLPEGYVLEIRRDSLSTVIHSGGS
jgi:predicted glutamine amidotransferase